MNTPLVTVFTPTFNRAHTLHRVFESLTQQTFRDFEWLVVDDGSTDNTQQLIDSWTQAADFPIHYFFQPNGGKHIAHNTALTLAEGTFLVIADSDDRFIPDALQIFTDTWAAISDADKPDMAGVWSLCMDEKGHIIGTPFPTSPWDGYWVDKTYRARCNGEHWHIQRLDVLRQFPFPPLFAGQGFCLPEGFIWKKINARYKYRCINTPMRIYHTSLDGLILTKPRTPRQLWLSDRSSKVMFEAILNEDINYFWLRPFWFCRWMVYYTKYAFGTGDDLTTIWQNLETNKVKCLFLCLLPIFPFVWLYSKGRRWLNNNVLNKK